MIWLEIFIKWARKKLGIVSPSAELTKAFGQAFDKSFEGTKQDNELISPPPQK